MKYVTALLACLAVASVNLPAAAAVPMCESDSCLDSPFDDGGATISCNSKCTYNAIHDAVICNAGGFADDDDNIVVAFSDDTDWIVFGFVGDAASGTPFCCDSQTDSSSTAKLKLHLPDSLSAGNYDDEVYLHSDTAYDSCSGASYLYWEELAAVVDLGAYNITVEGSEYGDDLGISSDDHDDQKCGNSYCDKITAVDVKNKFTVKGLGGADDVQVVAGTDGYVAYEGGNGADRLVGSDQENETDTIEGGNGDDLIDGKAGADILTGDEDDDDISGGAGADEIRGEGGDDILRGERGDDYMEGDYGADILYGGDGADTMYGSDYYYPGDENDYLYGGDGDDDLYGQGGHDVLCGQGDGPLGDYLHAGPAADTDYCAEDTDTLFNCDTEDPSCDRFP